MATWEYKNVVLERTGSKEEFGFNWSYGPWETSVGGVKQPLSIGLQQLGREGWELAGVVPTDLWDEGGRSPNSAHGVRAISCILLFKRLLDTEA